MGVDDLTLSTGRVATATVIDADTVEYGLTGLTAEVQLTVTIDSAAVRDAFGLPNQSAIVTFDLDFGTVAYPQPLVASGAVGLVGL